VFLNVVHCLFMCHHCEVVTITLQQHEDGHVCHTENSNCGLSQHSHTLILRLFNDVALTVEAMVYL
jgi:hypothetical protein